MTTRAAVASSVGANPRVRPEWLALHREAALEPGIAIIDAHHHLWDRPDWRYMLGDLLADIDCGHDIVATVFVQARAMHRALGPAEFAPVGETEFVNGVAAMSASGGYGRARICAGIVGFADLTLGARVEPVLEAHVRAGGDRFRGVRLITAWDADTSILNPAHIPPRGLLGDAKFREGFAVLARMGLSFDAWLYHPQIGELVDLARAFPQARIILDHLGGPLHIGAYAGRRDEVLRAWSTSLETLAACPNVALKVGGLGLRIAGFDFEQAAMPPTSEQLAAAWRPWVDTAIATFGPARCMFESNFPVDKGSYGYGVFWNACKRLVRGASAGEKAQLFAGTAAREYRLALP